LAELLFIFTYDISRDRPRRRVADLLEVACVRVQKSVFEARLPAREARRLGKRVARELEPGDSLRVYAVTENGLDRSFAYGPVPLPERQDFYLL
jgi:CRISPR-associated protein Cas2